SVAVQQHRVARREGYAVARQSQLGVPQEPIVLKCDSTARILVYAEQNQPTATGKGKRRFTRQGVISVIGMEHIAVLAEGRGAVNREWSRSHTIIRFELSATQQHQSVNFGIQAEVFSIEIVFVEAPGAEFKDAVTVVVHACYAVLFPVIIDICVRVEPARIYRVVNGAPLC